MHYEKMQDMTEKKTVAIGQSDAERHGGKKVVDYGEDGTVYTQHSPFYLINFQRICHIGMLYMWRQISNIKFNFLYNCSYHLDPFSVPCTIAFIYYLEHCLE